VIQSAFRKKRRNHKDRMERSRVATAELQAGRAGYMALLHHFIDVSVAALKVGYANLGVEFDLWKGEACVDPLIPDMIKEFKEKGIAEEDDGALIIIVKLRIILIILCMLWINAKLCILNKFSVPLLKLVGMSVISSSMPDLAQ